MAGLRVRTEAILARNEFGRFAREIEDGIDATLDEMGEMMDEQATANVMPLGRGRIGPRLKRRFRLVRAGNQVYLESLDPLTAIYEFGTVRGYRIEPRGEAALTNPEEGFGPVLGPGGPDDPVGVNHPGQPPGRFLLKSYRYAISRYMSVLRDNLPG